MSKQKRNPENFTHTPHPSERDRGPQPPYYANRDRFNSRAASKVFENFKRRQENWK